MVYPDEPDAAYYAFNDFIAPDIAPKTIKTALVSFYLMVDDYRDENNKAVNPPLQEFRRIRRVTDKGSILDILKPELLQVKAILPLKEWKRNNHLVTCTYYLGQFNMPPC